MSVVSDADGGSSRNRGRTVGADPDLFEYAMQRGWGDGLPLIAPTRDRVDEMLAVMEVEADEVIGAVPPLNGVATYEKVAANAVMAGCLPGYFPVVCGALEAALDPIFNLYGVQGTTSPAAPVVIVNGPIRLNYRFQSGQGAFGPGWRANATVGRAMRLILWNVGGGRPQVLGDEVGMPGFDMATQGFPGKYGFCAAENEEESPWDPLHVSRGYDKETSCVTVIAADSSHDFRDVASKSSEETLACIAATMGMWGTANMLYGAEPAFVISPEQANSLSDGGWTKEDVQRYLFECSRIDMSKLPRSTQEYVRVRRPKWFDFTSLPVCNDAKDIVILTIGGPGIHGVFLSTFSGSRSVTVPVLSGD